MMTRASAYDPLTVYLVLGQKRVFACALAWPGWCRSDKTEDGALDALVAYAPRSAVVAREWRGYPSSRRAWISRQIVSSRIKRSRHGLPLSYAYATSSIFLLSFEAHVAINVPVRDPNVR